jgi:uncharacterized membrane protein
LLFTALAGVLHLDDRSRSVLPWIAAGLLRYAATLTITRRVNVPLNNGLAEAGGPGEAGDLAAVRRRFEGPWVRWNLVRAATSTIAFGCLVGALVRHGAILA